VFEDWPTLEEVVQRTGISERTLHRKIKAGELRREYRRLKNRKPVSILDPESVATLAQPLHPIPATLPAVSPPAAIRPATLPQPDMAALSALLAGFNRTGVSVDRKLYLSIAEAAALSGLPKAYLKRQIQAGVLPAVKVPGWRILRDDLIAHRVG
jgi:excisionase family DNA binding protein